MTDDDIADLKVDLLRYGREYGDVYYLSAFDAIEELEDKIDRLQKAGEILLSLAYCDHQALREQLAVEPLAVDTPLKRARAVLKGESE